MEPTILKVVVNVNGLERTYQGDYHKMHSQDWNELVRDILDEVNEVEGERNTNHANDNQF